MAINATRADKNRQAAKDLANKLKLEARLQPKLRKLFKQIADDLEANIVVTGDAQTDDLHAKALEGILNEHYEAARSNFSNNLASNLDLQEENSKLWIVLLAIGAKLGKTTDSKPEILKLLRSYTQVRTNEFIRRNVANDVKNISKTTSLDLGASTNTARVALTEQLGRAPTRSELATGAREMFASHSLGRVGTIAATTTQNAVEGIKNIEVGVVSDFRSGSDLQLGDQREIEEPSVMEEEWVSMRDSIVRPAHWDADGQIKENGVFVVGGEELRYPGDTSLGASLKNVMNCRCTAVFSLEE